MSLKLTYYGQNDSVNCTPAIALSSDPGTDQQNLTNAGYLGGVIVALIAGSLANYAPHAAYTLQAANEPAFGSIGNIVPCDRAYGSTGSSGGNVPFATLLNGPGEFAGAIGPSGSRKAPVVRALWQGNVDNQGCVTNDGGYVVGQYLYCGSSELASTGKYVSSTGGYKDPSDTIPVGICTHVYSTTEPWLSVASLL
jgi:hypothetical protein